MVEGKPLHPTPQMPSTSPTPRRFDPAEVWPWENRPHEGPSTFGALLAVGLYAGLTLVLWRGLTVFQAEVVQRDRTQMNALMRPVVGPVRRVELDPRLAEPLALARDPRPFSEVLEEEDGASGETPSEDIEQPVGL